MIPVGPLTVADLRHARDLYGGTLSEYAGAWTLVGAEVVAGEFATFGPVASQAVA